MSIVKKSLSSVVIFSIGFGPFAYADEYTKEKICERLNNGLNPIQMAGLGAIGVSAALLVKTIPELRKEYEARKKFAISNISEKANETEMARFFYDRENEITKRFLAQKGIEKMVITTQKGETPEEAFVREFNNFEDKELGQSSLHKIVANYEKTIATPFDDSGRGNPGRNRIYMALVADDHSYERSQLAKAQKVEKARSGNVPLGEKSLTDISIPSQGNQKFNMKEALQIQASKFGKLGFDLTVQSELDAAFKWNTQRKTFSAGEKYTPKISKETKWVIKNLEDPKTSNSKREEFSELLKKNLMEDYEDLLPPLDRSLDAKELARTTKAREFILEKAAQNSIDAAIKSGGLSSLEKTTYAEKLLPSNYAGVAMGTTEGSPESKSIKSGYYDDFKEVKSFNEGNNGKLKGGKLATQRCTTGGLVGLAAVGVVGSLSHYCDNEISKDFEMSLPKANRDQFAKMKNGYDACLKAVDSDPTTFTAVKNYFQIRDKK